MIPSCTIFKFHHLAGALPLLTLPDGWFDEAEIGPNGVIEILRVPLKLMATAEFAQLSHVECANVRYEIKQAILVGEDKEVDGVVELVKHWEISLEPSN